MKRMLKEAIDNLRLLNEQLDELLERYRIKYYHEFILSVFSFGCFGIYLIYIYSRLPILFVHQATTFAYNCKEAIRPFDLSGIFFAMDPFFELVSSLTLLAGFLWGSIKILQHSMAKISEIELIPLPERIKKIEKEGEESENE